MRKVAQPAHLFWNKVFDNQVGGPQGWLALGFFIIGQAKLRFALRSDAGKRVSLKVSSSWGVLEFQWNWTGTVCWFKSMAGLVYFGLGSTWKKVLTKNGCG